MKTTNFDIAMKVANSVFGRNIKDYKEYISDKDSRLERNIIFSFLFESGMAIEKISELFDCRLDVIKTSLYYNDWALKHYKVGSSYINTYNLFLENVNELKDKLNV